jgi:serine/threonine protein kinase/tetratricopeptide (TPR) repeat protein
MPTLVPVDVSGGGCLSDNQINCLIDGRGQWDDFASIERHLADCAECRALVGTRAASLVSANVTATGEEEHDVTRAPAPELGAERYDVRREIARGGMGKILEAWDRRHRRRVALKVRLRGSVAIEARFAREVLLTARLQHPSIVALYDTGVLPSGEPFFVMKLIEGRSLAEVARDAHTLPRRLALLPHLLAITEALAYAHEQRIIHRDLKPANVLIGTFGETVVIDWGLAKDLDATDEPRDPAPDHDTPDVITIVGHALGTPHYMPPEQARGDVVDERGDVYALGALLYHVLAGAPPYAASTARTSREILVALLAGPPAQLAQQAPGLPADLVTIVDKAMARDPAARYGSARDMARDLQRFAQGRLVGAHSYSTSTLIRRWLWRYRAILAMVATLVIGIGVTAGLSIRRIERERDRADLERLAAEEGNRSARAHSDAAESLVEYTLVDLREQLAAVGRVDVMAGLGTEVEKYYDALSLRDGASETSASLARRAVGLDLLGEVAWSKQDLPAARMLATRAIGLLEHALVVAPADTHVRETLIKAELRLADIDSDLGQVEEARTLTRHAADAARALVREQPTSKSAPLLAVEAARDLRERLVGGPDPTAALDSARAVPDLLRTLTAADPENLDLQLKLSDSDIELGIAQGFFGLDAEMLASEQDALAVLARLAERTVDDTRVQDQQAIALQLSSGAELAMGRADAALELAKRSLALREQLVARDPANADWERRLALANACIADALRELGRTKEALAFSEQNLRLMEVIASKAPTSVAARGHVGRSLISLAETQRANGDRRAALASLVRAQEILGALATSDEMVWRWLLADALRAAGQIELETGMLGHAFTDATRADTLARQLVPDSDDSILILQARVRGLLGEVRAAQREPSDARALLGDARALFDRFWTRDHDRTEWFRGGPEVARSLASLMVQHGELSEARRCLEETSARIDELDAKGRISAPQRRLVSQLREDLAWIAR